MLTRIFALDIISKPDPFISKDNYHFFIAQNKEFQYIAKFLNSAC